MKRPGLFGTVSFVASLAVALPMAIIGFELMARHRPILGLVFLGLAIAVVFLPDYIISQLPRPWAGLRDRMPRIRGDKKR